jgi:hypothetical protein
MNCRRHGSKPTLALWMLVAVADAAILTAATGVPVMLLILIGLAVVAGGVFAARALTHRDATTTEVAARRRA